MLTADERKRLFHLHDGDRYITEAGSEDDQWLRALEEQGIVRLYDAVSRKHYYVLTEEGQRELGLI